MEARWLDLASFESLAPEWDSLVAETVPRSAFLTSWFLRARWIHSGDRDQVGIYALFDEERLAGAVPVRLDRDRGPFPPRTLRHLAAPRADFFSLPCRPGFENVLAEKFVSEIQQGMWRAGKLVLSSIDRWGPPEEALCEALKRKGWIVQTSTYPGFGYIATDAGMDADIRQHLKQAFKDTDRRCRKMRQTGRNLVYSSIDEATYRAFVPLLPHLEARRKKKGQRFTWQVHDLDFLREMLSLAERRKEAQLSLLAADQSPRAFCVFLRFNDIKYYYIPGYDATWQQWAPSLQLLRREIENTLADPSLKEFNLGRGLASYKKKISMETRLYYKIVAAPPRSRLLFQPDRLARTFLFDWPWAFSRIAKHAYKRTVRLARKNFKATTLEFICWSLEDLEEAATGLPENFEMRLLSASEARATGRRQFLEAARQADITAVLYGSSHGMSATPVSWFSLSSKSGFSISELRIRVSPPKGDAILFRGYTEPEWRGRGLYGFATLALLHWAKQRGYQRAWAYYEAKNKSSKRGLMKVTSTAKLAGAASLYQIRSLQWLRKGALKELGVSVLERNPNRP